MAKEKNKGTHLAIGLFLGCVTLAALGQLYFYLFGPGQAMVRAQSTTNGGNVHGFAWSSNFGWVSFNCNQPSIPENTCATNSYGVSIDAVTGQFSGYAWSSNVGWIYFGPPEEMPEAIASSSAPAAPRQWPVYDFTDRRVTGWAKVVSMGPDEGWLDFTRNVPRQPGVRGTIDEATRQVRFDGFAWDGDATNRVGMGWLEFNSAQAGYVYAVDLTGPLVENLVAPIRTNEAACLSGDSKTIGVSFNYENNFKYCYDTGGTSTNLTTCRDDAHCFDRFGAAFPTCKPGRLAKYDLVLKSDAAGDEPEWPDSQSDEIGTTTFRTAEDGAGISFYSNNDANFHDQLQWGAIYHVWVRVWDENDQSAGWVSLNRADDGGWIIEDGDQTTFTMPQHNVPKVDFIWTPTNPSKEEIVTFEPTDATSTTAVYRSTDGEETTGVTPDAGQGDSWSWVFNNGNPASSTEEKPKVQMVNNGLTSITLTLQDGDGYQCTTPPKTFNANLKLPNWKEQNPK